MTEENKKQAAAMEQESSALMEEATEEVVAVEEEMEEIVVMLDDKNLSIEGREYEIVKDYREGFNREKLGERFSDILGKYDYIVGDWGFEQLRLKGFYENTNTKVPQEQRIAALEDYIYEYCNFGCAYFVLKRTGGKKEESTNSKPRRPRVRQKPKDNKAAAKNNHKDQQKNKQQKNHVAEKPKSKSAKNQNKQPVKRTQKATDHKKAKDSGNQEKRHFQIRKKDKE